MPENSDLLPYYEEELTWLRRTGAEFARAYPGEASRLLLDDHPSPDPFTERLMEGVAFLTARVHRRLDDDFPEIVEALLNVIYPHFLRPTPAAAIVQFHLDPDREITQSETIKRNRQLYTRPSGDPPVQCRFRVCYDTQLWPVRIAAAEWLAPHEFPPALSREVAGAIRIRLQPFRGATFTKLEISSLRFFIDAEPRIAHTIYELLANNCASVYMSDPARGSAVSPVQLPPGSVLTAGWTDEESLLPSPKRSLPGYRLLHEYFAFSDKFLFVEVKNLAGRWDPRLGAGADLVFVISKFERQERLDAVRTILDADTFRLGCTPVVNLFSQLAEPISLDGTRHQYKVVPDLNQRENLEVFSIDEVVATDRRSMNARTLPPLFSWRHGAPSGNSFWISTQKQSAANDGRSEVWLSFVDVNSAHKVAEDDTISVRCTCSNGILPSQLLFGQNLKSGDFEPEGSTVKMITTVRRPTAPLPPPARGGMLWRLISHLSLNYLSLIAEGKEALQEMLRLYNSANSAFFDNQINSILKVSSSAEFARVVSPHGIVFARGTRVEMEIDEELFSGGGAWLFASVLEQFLGQYVSMNSFSQLDVRTPQRQKVMRKWAPRAGARMMP